jgi:hypothetical protein
VIALKVHHKTVYRFRQPVSLWAHRLILRPRESRDLRLMSHTLAITPASVLTWAHDVFGNAVAMDSKRLSSRGHTRPYCSPIRMLSGA